MLRYYKTKHNFQPLFRIKSVQLLSPHDAIKTSRIFGQETLIFEDIQDSYSAAKKPLISTKKKYTS